jgi:hypothetical protein
VASFLVGNFFGLRRADKSSEVARLLARNRVRNIGWPEVAKVAKILHCMKRNRTKFLNSILSFHFASKYSIFIHPHSKPYE